MSEPFERPNPSFSEREILDLALRYAAENTDNDEERVFMFLLDVADIYMGLVEHDQQAEEVAALVGESTGASLGSVADMGPLEIMLNGLQDHMEMRLDGSYPRLYGGDR